MGGIPGEGGMWEGSRGCGRDEGEGVSSLPWPRFFFFFFLEVPELISRTRNLLPAPRAPGSAKGRGVKLPAGRKGISDREDGRGTRANG